MHWLLLFALSVGAIALTWLGYPLLLWLRARSALPPEAVGVPAHWPTLSIIVVAHNEAAAITRKLQNVLALDYPADRIEVVLVCDGSTDGTEAAARALADPRLTVLGFVQRRGKAACLNDAVEAARGDVLMFCDVRQRIETSAAGLLVARLLQPGVGVVGGELAFEPEALAGLRPHRRCLLALRKAGPRAGVRQRFGGRRQRRPVRHASRRLHADSARDDSRRRADTDAARDGR
jgi:cellulose synthase/poly-beta-1,6-N-acetylglucosamine synthase-like glycosyltransferase